MAENIEQPKNNEQKPGSTISRKNFFKYAGASAVGAVAVGLYGCGDDGPTGPSMPDAVNLGSGDVGILNYAYALEQLEAAFYTQVIANPYSGMTDGENQILDDLRKHEVAHRDFFEAAISQVAPDAIIPGLTPNFDGVDFSDRGSVLQTAMAFEDLGVSAYNGAGQLISPDGAAYLVQAGKIVSVEARHAAAIRDLLNPGSADFAGDDIVDPTTGLDRALVPNDVLPTAANFIEETIDASNLPQPQQ